MAPTILPGERVLVHKMAYDLKVPFLDIPIVQWADPARGDLVVFRAPDGKLRLKRVIGLPGDVLEMRRNRLVVNGEDAQYEPCGPEDHEALGFEPPPRAKVLYERLGKKRYPVIWFGMPGSDFAPFEVPEAHYFVLGDNRNRSRDSRWFGPVSRNSITAQVTAVVLSFDRENGFSPRWKRFFLSLP